MDKEGLFKFLERKFKDRYDKGGNSYAQHLFSVQKRFTDRYGSTDWELCVVCLLHDVLEYTETTEDELRGVANVTERVIGLVKILTRETLEPYMEYIRRVALNSDARKIKLCDLEDNMDITRLHILKDSDFGLLRRYLTAWNYLNMNLDSNFTKKIKGGN